jgi:hypothetical protein
MDSIGEILVDFTRLSIHTPFTLTDLRLVVNRKHSLITRRYPLITRYNSHTFVRIHESWGKFFDMSTFFLPIVHGSPFPVNNL